ncbi:hypothetical protein V8G54_000863, partial [Vigna mungo]
MLIEFMGCFIHLIVHKKEKTVWDTLPFVVDRTQNSSYCIFDGSNCISQGSRILLREVVEIRNTHKAFNGCNLNKPKMFQSFVTLVLHIPLYGGGHCFLRLGTWRLVVA